LASCSLPYIYAPNELVYKKANNLEPGRQFRDGSIGCDLPLRHMSTMYNVANLLVSQTNPYIIPFLRTSQIIKNHKRYFLYRAKEKIFEILGGEIKLRLRQMKNANLIPRRFQMLANMCKI
jgi:predicted acylesterase/phospholipase RssA